MHPPDFAVRGLRGEIRPRLNAARTGKKKPKKKKRAVHKNLERTPPLVYLELLWHAIQLARRSGGGANNTFGFIISLKAKVGVNRGKSCTPPALHPHLGANGC